MRQPCSITLVELVGKLDLLEIKCHHCERHGRVSLARLIEEHGADTGLPELWQALAGDCVHARSTALNNRCAINYPQLPGVVAARNEDLSAIDPAGIILRGSK